MVFGIFSLLGRSVLLISDIVSMHRNIVMPRIYLFLCCLQLRISPADYRDCENSIPARDPSAFRSRLWLSNIWSKQYLNPQDGKLTDCQISMTLPLWEFRRLPLFIYWFIYHYYYYFKKRISYLVTFYFSF